MEVFFHFFFFFFLGWKELLLINTMTLLFAQAAALKGSDHRRPTNVSARLDAQQKKLNLPILPTTTIGSFPQTMDLRRVRREYKANKWVVLNNLFLKCLSDVYSKKKGFFLMPLMFPFFLVAESCCRISEEVYVRTIKEEINKVVKLQEELDIDVLVHGEPEVSFS